MPLVGSRNTFVFLPTGYGKSLCHCLLPEFGSACTREYRGLSLAKNATVISSSSVIDCAIFSSLLTAFSSSRKLCFLHTYALSRPFIDSLTGISPPVRKFQGSCVDSRSATPWRLS